MKNVNAILSLCKVLILVFVMTLSTNVNAQTDLPDAPVDTPAAPINDFIPLLIVLGIVLAGYVFLNKKKQQCS